MSEEFEFINCTAYSAPCPQCRGNKKYPEDNICISCQAKNAANESINKIIHPEPDRLEERPPSMIPGTKYDVDKP